MDHPCNSWVRSVFDVVSFDISRNWHTPTLGELAELLVFYDHVDLRIPVSRLHTLVPYDLPGMAFFRQLVQSRRLRITIDQLPLGEVALDLGLISGRFGPADPAGALERFAQAYPQRIEPPLNLSLLSSMSKADKATWVGDWDVMIGRCHVLGRGGAAEFDGLLDNARQKMDLISDPAFLSVALRAYGELQSKRMAGLLSAAQVSEIEVFGRTFKRLDADGETSADLLEFLSQADMLLDAVQGADKTDNYTVPAVDQWAQAVLRASWDRTPVRADLEGFRTTVTGGSNISTAIDTEIRQFHELEELLDAREPFAKAIRDRAPDASLAQAYFEEVSNKSWINSGPGKLIRFTFFSGAGLAVGAALSPLAGGLVGLGLGALDNFVVDSLLKGNACRTFVEDKLKPFAQGRGPS